MILYHASISDSANIIILSVIIRGVLAIPVFTQLTNPVHVHGLMFPFDAAPNHTHSTYFNAPLLPGSFRFPHFSIMNTSAWRAGTDNRHIFRQFNLFHATYLRKIQLSIV
jgi:hypothetical protein